MTARATGTWIGVWSGELLFQ